MYEREGHHLNFMSIESSCEIFNEENCLFSIQYNFDLNLFMCQAVGFNQYTQLYNRSEDCTPYFYNKETYLAIRNSNYVRMDDRFHLLVAYFDSYHSSECPRQCLPAWNCANTFDLHNCDWQYCFNDCEAGFKDTCEVVWQQGSRSIIEEAPCEKFTYHWYGINSQIEDFSTIEFSCDVFAASNDTCLISLQHNFEKEFFNCKSVSWDPLRGEYEAVENCAEAFFNKESWSTLRSDKKFMRDPRFEEIIAYFEKYHFGGDDCNGAITCLPNWNCARTFDFDYCQLNYCFSQCQG